MKTAVFVQARLNSSRLIHKMFLPLNNLSIIQSCLRFARKINADKHVLLVPYTNFLTFSKVAKEEGFEIFGGSEYDVLNRFAAAIKEYEVDYLIRVTGDKPIIAVKYTEFLLNICSYNDYDFCGFDDDPLRSTTGGAFSARSILQCNATIDDNESYLREHIKPCLLKYRDLYKIATYETPEELKSKNRNFSIDTKEEYEFMKDFFIKNNVTGEEIFEELLNKL